MRAPVDAIVSELASRQHGLVARRQLLAAGLSRGAVERRRARGLLVPVHRGVYAVGHRSRTAESRWLAAVLAAGPAAVLAGRSAAALWGIRSETHARVEVIATAGRRLGGIDAVRRRLEPDERTTSRGIPVTTPMRTLLDLAATLDAGSLERALREAEYLRLHDGITLARLLARHPTAGGTRTLRRIVREAELGRGRTRSELEERFLAFVAAHSLPRPRVNDRLEVGADRLEVDCHWPPARLVVELDGRAAHATRAAFEADRRRDRRLATAGWNVIRITWRELHHRPDDLAADLRRLLGAENGDRNAAPAISRSGAGAPTLTRGRTGPHRWR